MMIREDVQLYKLDLEGNSPFNKVDHEYMFRRSVKNNNIVIPPQAPFYQKSFRMYDKTGKPLVEGTDYEFYGIMGKLTQFTGAPVGLFVRLLKDELVEWYVDYQVVGNFDKISNEILNMLHSIYEDDRYVIYDNIENKPLWFVPEIHQHDLTYQIYGFTDLARELGRIADMQATMSHASDTMVTVLKNRLDVYITGFKKVLMDLLNSHIANLKDAHGTDKVAIGLGNVDNIRVATLEETLEGLRDDLTITPYNAGKAAEAAAGRNEKLFPSGSLPLLRYGSDTFIPPTIAGSFEGLGGLSRRTGAIIETDGTLLILQHRNNGKVGGLYFTRCQNWQSQDAIYDFTAYMYTHPTATAAGANLDVIISGSNKYVMVVGDSKKNMWWWCETHGTFNPDRHVLIRLSGDWVNDDMTYPVRDYVEYPWDRATLLVDANYKEHFCIYQTYSLNWFNTKDPSYLADIPENWRYFNLRCCAYSFNIVSGGSGGTKRAKVDYTHPIFGNRNDGYFLPWQIEAVKAADGRYLTKSLTAKFVGNARSAWLYRSTQGLWMSTGTPGEFAFRFEITASDIAEEAPFKGYNRRVVFRSKLTIGKVGNDTTVKVTPEPGNADLYTIDLNKLTSGNYDFDKYWLNVQGSLTPDNMDQIGASLIAPGVMQFSDGVGNVAFPPSYAIANVQYGENWQKLLTPPPDGVGGSWQYNTPDGRKIFDEVNPVGLATTFSNQAFFIADQNDYTSGGIIARQTLGNLSSWIFRPLSNLDSNYAHVPPPLSGNYQGVVYNNYAFKPEAMKLNIGPQIVLSSTLPSPGINNKDMYKYLFGAAAATTITGKGIDSPLNAPAGDGLWIQEARIGKVDGAIAITPVKVINVKTAMRRDVGPMFAALGITADDVAKTWTLTRAWSPNGVMLNVISVWSPRVPNVLVGVIVVDIIESGTPNTSAGYPVYPDCTIRVKATPKAITVNQALALPDAVYPNLETTVRTNGFGISIPYTSKNADGSVNKANFLVMTANAVNCRVTGGEIAPAVMFEVNAAGTVINKVSQFHNQSWGSDSTWSAVPYYGAGYSGTGIDIFEGAAIGSSIPEQQTSIYDAIAAIRLTNTRTIGISNILTPQYTVYFQKISNVILAGKMYDIPATYIDILNQDTNPANKVFYVYLYYSAGRAQYVITATVRPESATQSLIAKVVCGPTQIDQIIPYNRFSIDGASISSKRQGSSILASSGSVFEIGNTSSILLNGDFIP